MWRIPKHGLSLQEVLTMAAMNAAKIDETILRKAS